MQNPGRRTFFWLIRAAALKNPKKKKESSEGPWINAMTQALLEALTANLKGGGGSAAADYVGLGCCELDHIARSNGPLRKGGKARGRRLCSAIFSALLWRPSIRPRTFPSALPPLVPPPHRGLSLQPLPTPPIHLNPSVLYVARPSQSFSPVFSLLLIIWFPLCGRPSRSFI